MKSFLVSRLCGSWLAVGLALVALVPVLGLTGCGGGGGGASDGIGNYVQVRVGKGELQVRFPKEQDASGAWQTVFSGGNGSPVGFTITFSIEGTTSLYTVRFTGIQYSGAGQPVGCDKDLEAEAKYQGRNIVGLVHVTGL